MAPELLSEGKLSTASDVYAFGMLIHEVCRCKNSCAYCRNVRLSGLWIRPCEKLIVLLHHLSCPFPLRLCSGSRRDPYEEEDLDKVCFARKQVDQQQVAYSCLRWCMGLSWWSAFLYDWIRRALEICRCFRKFCPMADARFWIRAGQRWVFACVVGVLT